MTDSPSSTTRPSATRMLPIVAIVGRPNVGKSTLFNRLLRRRRAITDSVAGVTRDPVAAEWRLGSRRISLVDTGGFRTDATGLSALVSARTLEQIVEAELVLLVVDLEEVTAEDEEFINVVRSHRDKVILVVNKVDRPDQEASVWNFHSYGFPEVVGVSAEHRRNIEALGELIDRRLPRFEGEPEAAEDSTDAIRLAILGKPNTGKSTLMNRLTGSSRSLVSENPGTTRDAIEGTFAYRGHHFTLIDTAGIRRKSRVEEDLEYYSVHKAIGSIESADIVLLIIDVQSGVTDQDKKIASLAIDKGKGVILVMNKWDMLEEVPNLRVAQEDRVRFLFPVLEFAPFVPLSALRGNGIEELMKILLKVWRQLNTRVSTAKINKALKGWNARYAPPSGKGTPYRVRYLTQTSKNPVRFLLFVNRKKGFPVGWTQYLVNRIRKDLGFSSIPISVDVKDRQL